MSVTPSRLEVRLLGPVEVAVDGRPIDVDTRKAIALLGYLAAEPRAHTRGYLGDLLWPGADPARARAALRRTLSTLRSALGGRWIVADRDAVRFSPDIDADVDLDRFRLAAAEAHDHGPGDPCEGCSVPLRAAAAMVRGAFMDGFGLRDAPAFDDWMMASAEQVRREEAGVFERLAATLAREGRYADAIAAGVRWLEVEPLHEGAYRSLMLLHAWSGDRAGAVDAYRRCVAVLGRELGVEPLEETTELYEAILEGDLPRAPAPARAPVPTSEPVRPEPLVGRDAELRTLLAAISGPGIAVVAGALGIGKSRLLLELGREARADGFVVGATSGHPGTSGIAYGPIQSLLQDLLDDPDTASRIAALPSAVLGEVARLVPSLGDAPTAQPSDDAARTRFLDAMATVIGAAGERVLVVIDDLHLCDEATVEFVGFLATRRSRLGVSLVVSVRPEDTLSDGPVDRFLSNLGAFATRVPLDALSSEDVATLVEAFEVDRDEVLRWSGGNPFFAIEYARSGADARSGPAAAIRTLLSDRLAALDAATRQVMTAAAVLGTPFDADLLREVSGRSEDEVVSAVERLITRGVLREHPDGTIGFVNERVQEAAYGQTTLARRRLLHRRVATRLTSRRESASDPALVAAAASHRLAAGEDADAAVLSFRAGDLAASLFAPAEAAAHYETALALGHPDRAELYSRIGAMRTLTGAYGLAHAAYEAARAELHVEGRSGEAAVLGHHLGDLYRRLHRWEAAAASFEEAWVALPDDAPGRAPVAADWAYVEHRLGNDGRARELAATALIEADRCGEPDGIAHARNLAALLERDPATRRDLLQRALAAARRPDVRATVLNNLALEAAGEGDLATAVRLGEEALELALSSGDRHRTAAIHDNLADFLHRSGDDERAMEALKSAVALFSEVGLEPGGLEPGVWLLKRW